MRICLFGAGASGGHFAVKLARAGHDVSVIARGAHLAAIQAKGLTLVSGEHAWTVHPLAGDNPAEFGIQDVVIVAVKATALPAIAASLSPLIGPATAVVFPQNGMPWWYPLGLVGRPTPPDLPNFRLADRFLKSMAPSQILGGSIYSANVVSEPGVVVNDSPRRNRLDIGPIGPVATVDVDGLRAVLDGAGIASPAVSGDIRALVWTKLLHNMNGSVIALATANKSSIVRTDPDLGTIYRRVLAEGLAIAAAHGFPVEIDADAVIASIPDHKPSILQDYEQGRPMEIAEIVLAPQAFARAAGVPTPSFDVLSAVVTRLARDRGLYAG